MITIFFNPIIEELVFRFSFVNWIGQKLPIWVGIVISSLIFMLMHINGNLFIYFCLGIIFSGLYKISGTIMTPIMVHILLNGIILFAT
ncbi:CPBP family intramembrane glutamic endopeptidase [Vagococcus luciliae]|nr:CPBP family intramembrane glutamic endopeptidase [Vagococcus luciliae]